MALVVLDAERIGVRIRELGLGPGLLQDAVEWKRSVERLGGRLRVCRRRDQREHGRGNPDQSAHPRKGTLGRVNPRLLLALFLVGLFALGAAAYAIVGGRRRRA